MVTVCPGGEQLRGQPLPLDPGHRGPDNTKCTHKTGFSHSASPDVRPLTDGGVAGPGLVVHRAGRGYHRVERVLGVVTVPARPEVITCMRRVVKDYIDIHLTGKITADGLGGGGADSCLGVTDADDEVDGGPNPGGGGSEGGPGGTEGAAAPQV